MEYINFVNYLDNILNLELTSSLLIVIYFISKGVYQLWLLFTK